MSSQFRYDGRVQAVTGQALSGASIAVLTQPAQTQTQPGSPLATIFNAATSNSGSLTSASWSNTTQQITFVFTGTPPADVVAGSFISMSGVTPAGYNSPAWQVVSVSGVNVVVTTAFTQTAIANPGVYVSGGTAATSALPNPFFTDALGNFFFYAAAGIYTVQIFDTLGRITPLVLADQNVVAGGGSGSVSSVALTAPVEFVVAGSPITGSGTFAITKANENANTVWAGPTSGGAAAPAFRTLVTADMPAGTGTVTSVGQTISVPGSFLSSSVSGSPVTGSGTLGLTISLTNQNANQVFAGPGSGAAAPPTFRSLNAQDFPFTSTVLSSANILALQTTPITLVAAPGVGFMIAPILIVIKFFGGTIAYTDAGGAVSFSAGSLTQALPNNNIFLVTVSPNRRMALFEFNTFELGTAGNPPTEDNAAFTISKATNQFAAGNGTATILVWFYTVPTT